MELKPMLAPSVQGGLDLDSIKYPKIVQPKLDGFRCIDYAGTLWSRNDKRLRNSKIDELFTDLSKEIVLDGELYCQGLHFNELVHYLTKEGEELPKNLKYYIWDLLSVVEWDRKKSEDGYIHRYSIAKEYAKFNPRLQIVPSVQCNSKKEVLRVYKEYIKQGFEGAMLKDPSGPYKWGRCTLKQEYLLKLKPRPTLDLEIQGIEEGEGKFTGLAAHVLVTYKGVEINSGPGDGWTAAKLRDLFQNREQYIGKIIEVYFQEITPDGSFRFPKFSVIREDKDVSDK